MPLPTSTPPISIVSVNGSNESLTRVPPRHRLLELDCVGTSAAARDGRSERTAPCNRDQISAGMSSQRSMIAAARGSVPRGLGLLVVGQGHHPQREDLVDLRRVAEVAGALGRDRGEVVQDDRRRQHHVVVSSSPISTGNVPSLSQPRRPARRPVGGSSNDTNAPSSTASSVCTAIKRPAHRRVAIGAVLRPVGGVLHLDRHLEQRGSAIGAVGDDADQRRATSARRRIARPTPARDGRGARSTSSPAGSANGWPRVRIVERQQHEGGDVDLALDGLVPRHECAVVESSESTGRNDAPSSARASTVRRCTCRHRIRTCQPSAAHRDRRSPRCASTSARSPSTRRSGGGASTPNCQRSWFFCADARYGYRT